MGAGGEQLHSTGRGNGTDGDRVQLNTDGQTAGEQPAVSVSSEPEKEPETPIPDTSENETEPAPQEPETTPSEPENEPQPYRFTLFPTVEEQIELIAEAQAEEQRQESAPLVDHVPNGVISRALTSGGNDTHSIERIVAFFQKEPTGSAAANFLAKEYGEGGKGLSIAGKEYSVWFDSEGFRIAPGRSAHGPGSTLVSWLDAAIEIATLLRKGFYASQDKIDAARDNEFRELSETLWELRRDLSDEAREMNFFPSLAGIKFAGFPEDTRKYAELLKNPQTRQNVVTELQAFIAAFQENRKLLRFARSHDPEELYKQLSDMDRPVTQFQALDRFEAAKVSFITEDEIDRLLIGGGNVSDSKMRIYSYFVQGHDAKECVDFLGRVE